MQYPSKIVMIAKWEYYSIYENLKKNTDNYIFKRHFIDSGMQKQFSLYAKVKSFFIVFVSIFLENSFYVNVFCKSCDGI